MNNQPTIAVVGSGAIGAYYGARLFHGGFDVHLLFNRDYETVRRSGLIVRSFEGDFSIPAQQIRAYNDVRGMPPADIVLIAVKATSNHLFPKLIPPLLKDDTALVTLQNGIGNEEELASLFGAQRVIGAMAFICNNRVAPGVIEHQKEGWLRIGELTGKPTDRTHSICRMFERSGVECRAIDVLAHGRWEKLIWNVPFNGLGALLDKSTIELLDDPQTHAQVVAMMREVIDVARALGLHYPDDFIEKKLSFTRPMGAYLTSMQLDRRAGRPMEVDAIIGRVVSVAEALEVSVHSIRGLYRSMQQLNLDRAAAPKHKQEPQR